MMKFDVAIVGSGLAGLSVALHLAKTHKVAIISKRTLLDGASNWAQGGIASVLSENDSYESHTQDTLIAGNGLCHEATVRKVVAAGPKAVQELIDMGVAFTPSESQNQYDFEYHLTQEGAHSARRIIHAADMTGAALQKTLVEKVTENPNIVILEFHTAIDLIVTDKVCPDFSRNRVLGAYVINERDNIISAFLAKATILATGGHGKLYLYTTNPDVAAGDGVAMAWRAGADRKSVV